MAKKQPKNRQMPPQQQKQQHQRSPQFDRSMGFGEHVARGLYAGWRAIVFWDVEGFKFLEFSGRAVFRSFAALLFASPIYFLTMYLEGLSETADGMHSTPDWVLWIGYVVAWLVFAVAMFYLVRILNLGQHFIRFISGYHWARVFAIAMFLPYHILTEFRLVPIEADNYILMATAAWVLYAEIWMLKHVLKTMWPYAVFLALMDFATFQVIRSEIIRGFLTTAGT